MTNSFTALKSDYSALWNTLQIRPQRMAEVQHIFGKLTNTAAKARYQAVEAATGVPWFVIALIHDLEAGRRFDRHLHNGDPLSARTVHVPKNRPPGGNPPFTWEDSAKDALEFDKLTNISPWTVERIAFELEKFNGFGYRNHHPHVKTPYLWSFSNIYTCGKYTSDHGWSETAVSAQCGAMVMLRYMLDQGAITVPTEGHAPQPEPLPTPPSAPKYPGYYLKNGIEDDHNVEIVQRRLLDLNINPGPIDSDFGELTEHAVRLFQARSADETGEPLEIDGIVGPKTWGALFTPGATPLPDRPPPSSGLVAALLDIAGEQVGVREQPPTSNRGPEVDEYIRSVGLDPTQDSYPWCMCFVFWCYKQAAEQIHVPNQVPRTGGVHDAWNKSRRKSHDQNSGVTTITAEAAQRDPAQIVPGMVFYLSTGGSRGHTGIVADNVNGLLETIEGNTNDNGGREGIGVFRRTRRRIEHINLGFASYA